MAKATANPLLALGQEITEEHLVELDAEIDRTETRLLGMRRLRNVAAAFLGKEVKGPGGKRTKKPAAAPPGPAPSENGAAVDVRVSGDSVIAVAKAIAKHGPLMAQKAADLTKLSLPTVYGAFKHPWFDRQPDGWHLTTEGQQKLKSMG